MEEFSSLELITLPSKAAKLHGVITNISPMKQTGIGKSYFECQFADETSTVRMVGFDTAQQQKMAEHQEQQQTISVDNCEIKKSRYGDSMEVLLKQSTAVECSPRKLASVCNNYADIITLDEFFSMPDYKGITIIIKVVKISPKIEVKPGLEKQDIVVADATGSARLTLWQRDIDILEVNESYELQNVTVRSYNDKKYLTPPRLGFKFRGVSDIGDIADVEETVAEEKYKLNDATVALVTNFSIGKVCIVCKGKVEITSYRIGKCSKCSASQRLDKCAVQVSATLLISSTSGQQQSLQAFHSMIEAITVKNINNEETTEEEIVEDLLMAESFNVTYTTSNIISGVDRSQ